MPNYNEHRNTGFWVGAGFTFFASKIQQDREIQYGLRLDYNWSEIISKSILGGSGCAIGECFADIIEPATNPNHRGFVHSISFLGLCIAMLSQDKLSNVELFDLLFKSIVGGHALHIFQDSLTPKSIQFI